MLCPGIEAGIAEHPKQHHGPEVSGGTSHAWGGQEERGFYYISSWGLVEVPK